MALLTSSELELYRVVEADPNAKFLEETLQKLVHKLLTSSGEYDPRIHQFRAYVTDEVGINAWIRPDIGGITPIVVSKGLTERIGTEGKLATIIGHELGHLKFQLEFGHRPNGKLQEATADGYGLEYMRKASYDMREAREVFHAFPEILNTQARVGQSLGDVHTNKEERLQQVDLHIGAIQSQHAVEGVPVPLQQDIIDTAARVRHISFVEKELVRQNFYASDVPERLRILTALVDGHYKTHTLDKALLNPRYTDLQKSFQEGLTETAGFDRDNPQHVEAYNALLERFTLRDGVSKQFKHMRDGFLDSFQDVWNNAQSTTDPYLGFQHDIAASFENFVHAKTKEQALDAAERITELTTKYNFDNGAIFNNHIDSNKAEKYQQGEKANILASKQGYAAFILPTQESANNRLQNKGVSTATGMVEPPFAKHLQWLQETQSEELYYALSATGVFAKQHVPFVYDGAHNGAYFYASIPVAPAESDEYICDVWKGAESQRLAHIFDYTFSNDGTEIIGVEQPNTYPRLSKSNTPILTEEELIASEEKRLSALDTAHQKAVKEADWDLFEKRPFAFVDQYKDYLMPELSVVPRGGEVFPQAFVTKLGALIESGSQLHKDFAKHFFGNSYSMNGKLSAEEIDGMREFGSFGSYIFPESIFAEFVKAPYDFLKSDSVDFLTSETEKRQDKQRNVELRWISRDAFRSRLEEFYTQEMMPGSPQRETHKGTPIYDFMVDIETDVFKHGYEKHFEKRKEELEREKKLERDSPSDFGKTMVRKTEQAVAEADKMIKTFHNDPRNIMDRCTENALFLFSPINGYHISTWRDIPRRISDEFFEYAAADIDKVKLGDLEEEYRLKNADMHVGVTRRTPNAAMEQYSGADKSSNLDQLELPFEVNIDHPFQKFIRDNKFGLFNIGDQTHDASRSYYFHDGEDLAANDKWIHGDPASFWGYRVPQTPKELLGLFADLNLGINRPLPTIPEGLTLKSVLKELGNAAAGGDPQQGKIGAEILKAASVVDEKDNLTEKRIMQYETLRYLRDNNKPIPFEEFREILNLSKLETMFSKDISPHLARQAALNRTQDLDPKQPIDHLLKVYREYVSSGVFANDLELQQDFETSIIKRGSALGSDKQLEIAQELLCAPTKAEVDGITQNPDPESITTSNATIRAIRAVGYSANKGVLPSPKLKEWAIETLSQIEADKLKKDDCSPAYARKAIETIDRLRDTIRTNSNAREVTYRLADKIEAQHSVAYYVQERAGELSSAANLFVDAGIAHFSALHGAITQDEALRKDVVTFLTSPADTERTRTFLRKHHDSLSNALSNIAYSDKERAKEYAGKAGISLNKISGKSGNIYISEESKINALLQLHNNFWDYPFEARTGLINFYIFPTNMIPQKEMARFMGEAISSVGHELAGDVFSGKDSKSLGAQYLHSPKNESKIVAQIAGRAHLPFESVHEKINTSFSRARDDYKWSQVGDIQNEILGKSLGSSPDKAVAEKIIKAYLSVAEPEYRLLLLSSMQVASYPDGTSHSVSTGRMLDIVLSAFGEAGDKVKQAIHSNPSTPQHIAEALANSKTATRKPTRPEQVEYLEKYGPPQTGANTDIRRIGALLGAGSYGVTLETEKMNGAKTAVTILRPGSRERSELHFKRFLQAAKIVAQEDPKLKPIIAIIQQAANMVLPETDMDISARQSAHAAENLNEVVVKVDGHNFEYQTVKWLGHGVSHDLNGQIVSGYKETEIAHGKHYNELAGIEESRVAEKKFELGRITSDQLREVREENAYKVASAKSHLAVGTLQILSGHPFDHDIHGGQIRQEGDTIKKFDDGAVGPLDKDGNLITPTADMKKALRKILTASLIETYAKDKAFKVFKAFTSASTEVCRFVPPVKKAIQYANGKYDLALDEQKKAALAQATEKGKDLDLVEVNSPYRDDPLRGLKSAIDKRFAPELFTVMAHKIDKYKGMSTTKDYLTSVQRGFLALGDYYKELSPKEFDHVMGSILQSGQLDPTIVKQGVISRLVKNRLLAGREPFEIVQGNPNRNQGMDYAHKRTEPSPEQLGYDKYLQDAKISNALQGNNNIALPLKHNIQAKTVAQPKTKDTIASQRNDQGLSVKATPWNVERLGKVNDRIGEAGIAVQLADAAIKRDPEKAFEVAGTAATLHAGMKLAGKYLPVAGEVVGSLFAAKDTYDAVKAGNTTRAVVSGVETTLYSVATVSGTAAAFNFWNPAGWGAGAVAVGAGAAAVTISSAKAVYDNWNTVKGWFGYGDNPIAQFTPHKAEPVTLSGNGTNLNTRPKKNVKSAYTPRRNYSQLREKTSAAKAKAAKANAANAANALPPHHPTPALRQHLSLYHD